MDSQLLIVICFFCIMFFITCKYIQKNGLIKLGSIILSVYSVSIFCSIFLVNSRLFRHDHEVNILAYLYWIIVFLIICKPVFLFDKFRITSIKYNYKVIHWVLAFAGIVSILPLFEQIVHAREMLMVSSFEEQFADSYASRMERDATDFLSSYGKVCLFLVRGLFDISILFLYPFLREYKKNKHKIIDSISIIMIFVCANIYPIFLGTRVKAVDSILKIAIYFGIIFYLLKKEEVLMIRKYIVILVGFTAIFFIIMTFARIGKIRSTNNKVTTSFFLLRYAGEGTMIFSENLPYLKRTTNGDRCFYFINYFYKDKLDVISRDKRLEYEVKLGIRTGIFYTFLGEFVYDIGWVNTFIFMSLISFFMYNYIKKEFQKKSIRISTVYALFIYSFVIISGFTMYRYSYERSFHYLYFLMLYLFLRFFKM